MTLSTSSIKFTHLQVEYGGPSSPINLTDYHRGGSIVDINQTSPYGTIPASGTINFSIFKGTTKYVPPPATFSATISSNQQNLNLRTWALANGWDGSAAATITIGVIAISSINVVSYALTINGSWPNGLTVINNGYILGAGGQGGIGAGGGSSAGSGVFGGPAMSVAAGLNVTFTNNGIIGGGGGGGGGGGYAVTLTNGLEAYGGAGGGGAGAVHGLSGEDYSGLAGSNSAGNGTANSGGYGNQGQTSYDGSSNQTAYGGTGGTGGGLGSAGGSGSSGFTDDGGFGVTAGGSGGVGGHALDGKSYVNSGSGISGTYYGTQI
jgi:hypothetical protein